MNNPLFTNKKQFLLILAPGVLYLLIFLVVPLLSTVTFSFFKYDRIQVYIPEFTLENYERFLLDAFYLKVLWRSIRVGVLTTLICLILGYPVAYFLARTKSPHKGLYVFLVIVPLMIGVIVRTYGWIILLGSQGIINNLLMALHIVSDPVRLLYNEGAVIVGIVEVMLPFMILPLMSSIQNIDVSQEEAARTMGASRTKVFFKILLPLSIPGIVSGSLLVLTLSISALSTPIFLGGPKMLMVAVLIWQQMLAAFNWSFGSAISMILMVVTGLIIVFYLRAIRK
jgi:putative spermidine/putrescine transport system permease protein